MSASSRPTNQLDALPAQTVRRIGSYEIDELRQWAAQAGHRFVLVECSDCVDKRSVLKAIGRAFDFPEWFGANLDALYDCLTDLADRGERGWLVVLERLPHEQRFTDEQQALLLDVFRDAADVFAERGIALRVFYG